MATTAPRASFATARFRFRLPDAVSVLAERDFRVIWTGQAISMVGTWMQMVAQGILVLRLWDSAFALGALTFANAVPSLLVMLFGGVLADRADKRRILIYTQVCMMIAALVIGVFVLTDMVQYWMLLAATVAIGVAFGYDMPAYQAFLPELVPQEKIGQVVALNSSTFHGTRMIGPAIAGMIIGVFGLATAYFLNAASFVAVILSLLIIRHRPAPGHGGPDVSAIEGLKQGIRHVRGRPNIRALLILTSLNTTFLFPVVAILTPLYVKDVLHAGPSVLGLLWAGSGVGAMIGALVLIWWNRQLRALRIWLGVLLAPAGLVVLALTRQPLVAVPVMAGISFAFSSQLGQVQTMIQESTPAQFRGRVMSLHGITFNGTMPFAALISSLAAVAFGLPAVMIVSAALFGLAAVAVLRFAGGGIDQVVAASRAEHDVIALQPVPPGR